MNIITADISHLEIVTPLFDAYRMFYKQESDLSGAKAFIKNNIESEESVIYIALAPDNQPLGFVQLYPTWESVSMSKRWVLYDLFVTPEGRGKGTGRELMNRGLKLAQDTDAKFIMLETATDNLSAQSLYESLGYERDTEFFSYCLDVDD